MEKWKCEICGSGFENFHAQGFDNKIYCPLCYFKKLSADLQVENETLKKKIEEKLEDSEKARKEASDIVENKILESTLESYVCLKVEDYLKLKNILDIDKGE